ncbi:MAG: tryptophan synthase subunit alpha [Deltaproteobacteria bacterium]|nr:tryptophan synthase subunit alpha [Deltaproteobacteria bacterium]
MNEQQSNRLEKALGELKAGGRKALVIYLMAGDPDKGFTESLVPELAQAGADVVELGFPFSDPVADGPVIQAAATRAMASFRGLGDYLDLIARIRKKSSIPLVTMTYYNPIFRYGEEAFARDAVQAGLDGAIIPDLPVDEAGQWTDICGQAGLCPVLLDAPNSDEDHSRRIAAAARGFIYLVSLKGVTGTDQGLGENLAERVNRLRGFSDTPLVVGFGISTPEQARQVGAISDGVVVGSGAVSRIFSAPGPAEARRQVLDYVRALRAGLDSAV